MATDNKEIIKQAIADFDSIEAAIEESGVDVPYDTNTSEYGNKVRAVYAKGVEDGVKQNITIDSELSETSTNAVQNKVITQKLNTMQSGIDDAISLGLDGASAGQIIKISQVNEAGKPIEWEAVEVGAGLAISSLGVISVKSDSELSETSTKPVQNRIITQKVNSMQTDIDDAQSERITNTELEAILK